MKVAKIRLLGLDLKPRHYALRIFASKGIRSEFGNEE